MTYKVQSDMAETTKEAASTKAGAEEMKCLSPSSYPGRTSFQNQQLVVRTDEAQLWLPVKASPTGVKV